MRAGGSSPIPARRPECAHLHFVQLFRAEYLALQSGFLAHFCCPLAEDGRGHPVAGLVDQVAGKVLRLAEDDALGVSCIDLGLVCACGAEDGKILDALVLTVGAVGVGIEVSDQRAFDGGASGGMCCERFSRRKRDCEFTDGAGLGEAYGGSGCLADVVDGSFCLLANPTMSRRLAFIPAGAWSSRVSEAAALNSPLGMRIWRLKVGRRLR